MMRDAIERIGASGEGTSAVVHAESPTPPLALVAARTTERGGGWEGAAAGRCPGETE